MTTTLAPEKENAPAWGLEPLTGRVVLVTGTASGIGLATARALVDTGARVHAADFRPELARERLGAERLATGRLAVHPLDVTDGSRVEALVAGLGEETPLDALVCCAGTNVPDRRLEVLSEQSWRLLLETNLTGVFSCLRAAMPQLRKTRGHAVVIASVSALWPDVSGPAYQASKAGVLALMRAAAVEEHDRGVRFTSILPGMVATELLDRRPEPTPDDVRARCLQPTDVAAAILFALSLPPRACLAELTIVPNELQALGRT